MTYKEIKKNEEVLAYLKKGNDNLGTMGFTDHSDAHCAMVAERAAMILKKFRLLRSRYRAGKDRRFHA